MGVDYQARQIYDMQIKDVTTSPEKWKSWIVNTFSDKFF